MADKNTVEIRLLLKDQISKAYSNVRKSITSNNNKTKASLKSVETQAHKTQISLGTVVKAAAGFFVFRQVNQLIRESIQLAGEQQAAEAKVAAAIKSTAGAAGLNSDELRKMARELQNVTTVGDETILRGQAMLLTFKSIGKDVFPTATEAMLNLSQAMGTDVKESAIQLGKALNDPITGLTSLRRVGITFSESQEDTIKGMQKMGNIAGAQKLILAELESQFGGMARALAKTDAGKMIQLGNVMGDIKEDIGSAILPDVIELTQEFASFLKVAQETGVISEIFNVLAGSIKFNIALMKQFNQGLQIAKADQTRKGASQRVATLEHELELLEKSDDALLELAKGNDIVAKKRDELLKATREWGKAENALLDLRSKEPALDKFIGDQRDRLEKLRIKGIEEEIAKRAELRMVERNQGLNTPGGGGEGPTDKEIKAAQDRKSAAALVLQEIQLAQMEGRAKELAEWEIQRAAKETILRDAHESEKSLIDLNRQQIADINKKWNEIETRNAQEESRKLIAIKNNEMRARMNIANQIIGLGKTMFGENKFFFAAEQALAAARVIFNTQVAAAAAVAPPPVGLGVLGIPLAGYIKAQGALGVAAIMAQTIKGFQDGGILGGTSTSGDKTLYRGNAGEMILNKAQQNNLLSIANGRGGSNITFEAPIINVANGNPAVIAQAVTETYQEQIKRFADMQRDAKVLQI